MSGLSSVVAGLGSGLVTVSPVGPAEPVKGVVDGLDDERDGQSLDPDAGTGRVRRCGNATTATAPTAPMTGSTPGL